MCIYRLKTFGDYADIMNHKDYEINEAGGIIMATSSIFASFDIRDKETAEKFVKALEESANGPEWKPISSVKAPLTDKSAILELWAKREQKA